MKPNQGFAFADPLRLCAFAVSALLALAMVGHAVGAPLGFDDARHLLNRTSLAAGPRDIEAFARLDREQAVDRLLAWTGKPAGAPPPAWANEPFESLRRFRGMSPEERKLAQREIFRKSFELQSWWLTEMLTTPSPLTEKMTLFWHNHFPPSGSGGGQPHWTHVSRIRLRHPCGVEGVAHIPRLLRAA